MNGRHFAAWGNDNEPQQPRIGLQVIDVGTWDGQPVPEREWVVPGWILPRAVTLISGAGGTGKSLLVQQWLSAITMGDAFMGVRATAPAPCLYVNCEDDIEELHRRQVAIARAFERRIGSYAGQMHLVARIGMDNPLGVIGDDGKFQPSPFYYEIREAALEIGAKVIALDNAMQLYVGNLNDPREVTVFCNALSRLALDTGAAVILAGHVAKVAGSEFAGSMAWENAVRMRLFLKRETDDEGAEIEDSDRRILSRGKANSARKGERLTMIWHEGAFYNEGDVAGTDGRLAIEEAAFLRCLDAATEQRRNVSHMPSKNWAPAVFAAMPEASGVGKKALEQAMERLFASGEIIANQELWRDQKNRRWAVGIARKEGAQTPRKPEREKVQDDAEFEAKVAQFQEFAQKIESAQTPAQTDAQTPRKPRANPAQTRANTPPYTTYMEGGASGAPALSVDYDQDGAQPPQPDDPGYWQQHADEIGMVPDWAPDGEPDGDAEPWL